MRGFNELTIEQQDELKTWVVEFAYDLWDNETKYTSELYSATDWTSKVNKFLEYNLNKAMNNLGFDALFPTSSADVDPLVMNGISTTTGNHDFFSQVGNGYLLGKVESVSKTDFDSIDELF